VEIETGEIHIGRFGDFDVALGTLNDVNLVPQTFHEASFVRGVYAISLGFGKSLFEELSLEDLGSLRENDALSRDGGGDEGDIFGQAGALYFFDGVHGGNGEVGRFAATSFFNNTGNLLDRNEGAHSIMDDDQFRVFGNKFERLSDGTLTGIGAFYDKDGLAKVLLANASVEAFEEIASGSNNDVTD